MYPRVFSSSGEPGGRGPNSTCLRTCSKARSPSKSEAVFAGEDEESAGLESTGLGPLLGQPSNINGRVSSVASEKKRLDLRFNSDERVWFGMLSVSVAFDRELDRFTRSTILWSIQAGLDRPHILRAQPRRKVSSPG